jgi:peptidoglycan hydrolase-like protein with peptidoglycan-binding domain
MYEYETPDTRRADERRTAPSLATWLGIFVLLSAIAAPSAEARKQWKVTAEPIVDIANGEPMTMVVSLREQTIDIYRGLTRIGQSKVSTGMRGYGTPAGAYSILEKRRYHHSNLYSGAPMPWMQRLTWSGIALHAGALPGYPASHGCLRLAFSFAPQLFNITTGGENVIVAYERVEPETIAHQALFQPLAAPADAASVQAALAIQSIVATVPTPASDSSDSSPKTPAEAFAALPRAAESPSLAPLRILVTRRTERDRAIGLQTMLAELGYLTQQNFTGRIGKETVTALKEFQKAKGLSQDGKLTDDLVVKVYEAAGKTEPPKGHLFVRQDYRRVFDVPIALRNPDEPLGTHVFTAMKFVPGDATAQWMAISLEGGDPASVLDRIEIPDESRNKIAEKLTPGSTIIIGERSIDSAILPEGDDFLVLTKDTPELVAERPKAKVKQAKAAPAAKRRQRTARRYTHANPYLVGPRRDRPRLFSRWFSRR